MVLVIEGLDKGTGRGGDVDAGKFGLAERLKEKAGRDSAARSADELWERPAHCLADPLRVALDVFAHLIGSVSRRGLREQIARRGPSARNLQRSQPVSPQDLSRPQ